MPAQPSRRALLTSSLAGVAAVGVLGARASDATATPAAPAAGTRPLPATHDQVLHTVRRLTFGATPELVAHVRKVGVQFWLDEQLGAMPDVNGTISGLGVGMLPVPTVATTTVDSHLGHNAVADLQLATISRALFGDQQVFELMAEFWSNHLSINANADRVGAYKVADDRDVIRKYALGSFSDMLKASAQSPAMLRYLNNDTSAGRQPNENYARELLELHTVGVHGGYKQVDVHNAALVLTGLTVDPNTTRFSYQPSWHATGPVKVMGWSSANADAHKGLDVALSLVQYLATHPATAERIATKLVRRLVSDNPPAGLVASSARVFQANGTAIVPVIRHIVGSAEFARSVGAKSQRPYEWFTAAVRALGLKAQPAAQFTGSYVVNATQQLAQAPFEWVPPDGYPDTTAAWASTASMLMRWNVAQALVHGQIGGLQPVDVNALIGTPIPTTAGALVTRLSTRLLSAAPRTPLKAAVLHGVSMADNRVISAATARYLALPMAALLLSSPEAQVR